MKKKNKTPVYRNWLVKDLVWVDDTPLRQSAVENCVSIFHSLKEKEDFLKKHEECDLPAFLNWKKDHFSEEMEKIQTLQARLDELGMIIHQVVEEQRLDGCSGAVAYKRLMKRKEDAKHFWEKMSEFKSKPGFQEDPHSDPEFEEFLKEEFSKNSFEDEDDDDAFFEEEDFEDFKEQFTRNFFGHRGDDSGGGERSEEFHHENFSHQLFRQHEKKLSGSDDQELKDLYRILARKLHPDLNPNLSPSELDLWHQVKNAYESKNLALMNQLIIETDYLANNEPNFRLIRTLGQLRAILKQLRSKLSKVNKNLTSHRRGPAWNFTSLQQNLKATKELKSKMAEEFASREHWLNTEFRLKEKIVEKWKNPRSSSPKSKKKPSRSRSTLERI